MKLFKFKDYNLEIAEEAYALKPFRKLIDRDKSKDKRRAMEELAYVYFMEDPRSDYQMYTDREERGRKIVEGQGMKEGWIPDKLVEDAMEFYSSFKTESALLLEDVRAAVANLRSYIRNIDLNDTDNNNKPKYTLNTYTSAISMIPKIITSLDEAEKTIAREIAQNDKVRGTAEKAIFEDL